MPLPGLNMVMRQRPAPFLWDGPYDIGGGGVQGAATLVVTVGRDCPKGSLVIVGELGVNVNNVSSDTLADTQSNIYLSAKYQDCNNTSGAGGLRVWSCELSKALVGGVDKITLTLAGAGSGRAMSCILLTNNATSPLDGAVSVGAGGLNQAPSVTSGTPTQKNEMMIAFVGWGGQAVITQDNRWAQPPNFYNHAGAQANIAGGHVFNADDTAQKIYAPTLSQTNVWAAIIVGFKKKANLP